MSPTTPAHEGMKYAGGGLDKGECGIEISVVSERHNGVLACTMGYKTGSVEGSGYMRLTVASK